MRLRGPGHLGLAVVAPLLLAGGLLAQSLPGYQARGTVELRLPSGTTTGTISVDLAASGACRVTLAFSSPAQPRVSTAVFNGTSVEATGPALLAQAAPLPVDPRIGCALLAPRPSSPEVSVSAVPGTPQAATLRCAWFGHQLELAYAYATAASALPSTVTELIDGARRLTVTFTSVTARTFPASEFTVPAGATPQ